MLASLDLFSGAWNTFTYQRRNTWKKCQFENIILISHVAKQFEWWDLCTIFTANWMFCSSPWQRGGSPTDRPHSRRTRFDTGPTADGASRTSPAGRRFDSDIYLGCPGRPPFSASGEGGTRADPSGKPGPSASWRCPRPGLERRACARARSWNS